MTKWQTRQALYLLGLTGILYLFSCKSQDIILTANILPNSPFFWTSSLFLRIGESVLGLI